MPVQRRIMGWSPGFVPAQPACPTCGRDTTRSEGWSTGQCDDCYADDHEPSVCCVCGNDEHTPEQLRECIDSALAPYLSCTNCGWAVPADRTECDSCGASL